LPPRTDFLPFARADLDESELAELRETLASGWLTTGPKTKQLEAEFAAYVGAPHAVAVNSGTAAMHLALEAIGLREGDEVIVPTYTFAATAEVVRYFNARPVLVDVNPETLNIDPAAAAAAVSPRTRAIMPVHLAGLPCDLDTLHALAQKHDLRVIEDAAHALPARWNGRLIGSHSDITCFSFYATKPLATGEGGMLTTANAEWAERCRMMSLHGISRDAWKRYTAEGSWQYDIIAPGYKYNLTDIAAGIGLAQLRKLERMWQRRVEIARRYSAAFAALPEVQPPPAGAERQHAWHLYLLRLNLNRLTLDRAQFIEALRALKIGTSVHFIPLHLHSYYRNTYGCQPEDLPAAYREYQRVISLPIYSRMADSDVQDVIDAVADIVARHRR
jgi:perosamine synthetase